MNEIDIHPEELLDRAVTGELDEAEDRRLMAHVVNCEACAFELQMKHEFARDTTPNDADRDLAAHALLRLRSRPETIPQLPSAKPKRWSKTALIIAAAMIVVFTSGVALGTIIWHVKSIASSGAVDEPRSETPSSQRRPRPSPPAAEVPLEESPPVLPPTVIEARESTSTDREHSPSPGPRRVETSTPQGAAQLFSAANQARRRQEHAEAIRLYRNLQRQHPGSREEVLSRVTLGMLLMRRGGDAAGALTLFESYLAARPSGVMAEEATVGRALTLRRLGRTSAERQAWEALLTNYPRSIHRERAEERLGELR